jgi:hypothetical protein
VLARGSSPFLEMTPWVSSVRHRLRIKAGLILSMLFISRR